MRPALGAMLRQHVIYLVYMQYVRLYIIHVTIKTLAGAFHVLFTKRVGGLYRCFVFCS